VAGCEDCQQFFGACDALTAALKRDAVRQWRDAPPGLEQTIIRAVNLSTRESAHLPRGSGAWMSFAVVAACALGVMLVYQSRAPAGSAVPASAANVATANAVDPATLAAANEIIASVPSDLLAEMQPKAEALLQQDPLQNEVDAIASDARTAVSFLARNFLPRAVDRPASGE
jgi:hypothetical protein